MADSTPRYERTEQFERAVNDGSTESNVTFAEWGITPDPATQGMVFFRDVASGQVAAVIRPEDAAVLFRPVGTP